VKSRYLSLPILFILLLCSLLGIPTQVLADNGNTTLVHACVDNKNAAVRIVAPTGTCKGNETAHHWATDTRTISGESRITATETKNSAQDTAIANLQAQSGESGGLVVVDSLGQVVGKVLSASRSVLVLRIVDDTPFAVIVLPNSFDGHTLRYYFTEPDCGGAAYMEADPYPFWQIVLTEDDVTGYYPGLPYEVLLFQAVSIAGTCSGDDYTALAGPRTAVDLSTWATFPVHLE